MKSLFRFFVFVFLMRPLLAAENQPQAPVLLGVDVLESQDYALLQGKQVGLVTNQTGVDSRGRSTADLLAKAPGVKLVALFSPEHGIRGTSEAGQSIGDTIDPKLHLPVYSLYGAIQKPTPEMLNSIDVLVFDMQDVGARFYTYLTTMGMAMEACAQRGIAFMVLDRPNPLGGSVVEGQVLDSRIRHFTAYYDIPVRHGLTAGELAGWYNQTQKLGVQLTIISVKNWKREELWLDTGLPFVPPSPNIRNPTAALLYAGIGMFEATNIAVGRGTETPFELFGAPWMHGEVMSNRLNDLQLPGLKFMAASFTPTSDDYAGQPCSGVRIRVTDPQLVRPVDLFVYISCLLRELSAKDFQPRWDEVARVTGSHDFEHLFIENKPAQDILDVFHKSADDLEKHGRRICSIEAMAIYLKQMQLGPMQNYVYLVGDSETKEAAVVDPAWNVPAIIKEAQEDGYRITHVLLSHGHFDHINGVEEVVEKTDATVCAEKSELEEFIYEGAGGMVIPRSSLKKTSVAESVRVGNLDIEMIHTPGHTPGSRCMLVRAKSGGYAEALMTGDTLFIGTIGRCDFPYSSPKDLFQSLGKIKKLDDAVTFYPGHDYGASEHNTLGKEKKTNPFLMARSIEDFLQLVRH